MATENAEPLVSQPVVVCATDEWVLQRRGENYELLPHDGNSTLSSWPIQAIEWALFHADIHNPQREKRPRVCPDLAGTIHRTNEAMPETIEQWYSLCSYRSSDVG